MAKRAKGVESGGSVEGAIGGFAEDLGRLLGHARNKADSWLGQRQAIVKQLTQLRDEASKLLKQLRHEAQRVVCRGRPAGGQKDRREGGDQTPPQDVQGGAGGDFGGAEGAVGEAEGREELEVSD